MKDTKKEIQTFFSPYFDTEMYVKMFEKQGFEVICISYGYTSFYDLIIYEREVKQ